MGKVGKALKQVLENHNISQSEVAELMDTTRASVSRWFHGKVDPTGDTILEIVEALREIEPLAAKEFVIFYLGELAGIPRKQKSYLAKLRRDLNLTQRQIAEVLGVTVETINNWEVGLSEPKLTIRQVKSLLGVLQCSLDDLPDDLGSI